MTAGPGPATTIPVARPAWARTLVLVCGALLSRPSFGDDHADHHPAGAAPPAAVAQDAPAGSAPPPGPGGMANMAAMMAEMMSAAPKKGGCAGGDCGGVAAKTPVYPSLMTLPSLTPEKRAEIGALANQQINEGMARLAKGSELLNRATQAADNVGMQQSVGLMREGLDELEAGIAAWRVLSEGKAPRNLALSWFKREMNLASPVQDERGAVLGVTPFHLFTMVLLVGFTLAMLVMYFFKMRRAAALFGRLEETGKKPPPGSAAPLGGGAPKAPGGEKSAGPRGGDAGAEKGKPAPQEKEKAEPEAPVAPNPQPKTETPTSAPSAGPGGADAGADEGEAKASRETENASGTPEAQVGTQSKNSEAAPLEATDKSQAKTDSTTAATPPQTGGLGGAPAEKEAPGAPEGATGGGTEKVGVPATLLPRQKEKALVGSQARVARDQQPKTEKTATAPAPPVVPPAQSPQKSDSPTSPRTQTAEQPPQAKIVTANWRGQLRIDRLITETPTVKTFRLRPAEGDGPLPFTFVPGQFLNVAFWVGGARMNRSYSISSSPTERSYVDLTIRREPRGAVSRHIDDLLIVGDEIESGGPVGRFTFSGTEAESVVLISGGVGITPMMSITRYLTERAWPGEIFFLYVCRSQADFIFQKQLSELEGVNPKLHVVVVMSRPEGTDWKGPRGHLTKELLAKTVPNLRSRRIHLCGPVPMMESTRALLAELGVSSEQIKTEAFGAVKPVPPAPGEPPKPTAPATGPLVTFTKNGKTAKIHEGQTVLELSEELGIGIEFSCRVGTCGVCKVKMTAGEVDMAVDDALDANDKATGVILACQAKPKNPVTVEA